MCFFFLFYENIILKIDNIFIQASEKIEFKNIINYFEILF